MVWLTPTWQITQTKALSCDHAYSLGGELHISCVQVLSFTELLENEDYKLFKTNFLKAFSSNSKHSLVKGVSNGMQTVLGNAASLDHLEVQVEANQISVDFTQCLKDNGYVTGNNQKFMEFFLYMIFLKERGRKNTLSLEYKPTEGKLTWILHEIESKN